MATVKLERMKAAVAAAAQVPDVVDLSEEEEVCTAAENPGTLRFHGTNNHEEVENNDDGRKSTEIKDLRKRVVELEEEMEALQSEMRLLKRKFRAIDPQGPEYENIIEERVFRILDSQNWRISRLMLRDDGPTLNSYARGKPTRTPVKRMPPRPRLTSVELKRAKHFEDYESPADAGEVDGDGDDSDYQDPTYNYNDRENVKPVRVPRRRMPVQTGRRSGGKPVERGLIVKKAPSDGAQDEMFGNDFDEGGSHETSSQVPKTKNKSKGNESIIQAGDVSVILDQDIVMEDEDKKPRAGRKRSGNARERPKNVQCSYCPNTFRDKHDATRHERIHTGEKPFACDVCGPDMRFTQSFHLSRHMEKYHY